MQLTSHLIPLTIKSLHINLVNRRACFVRFMGSLVNQT